MFAIACAQSAAKHPVYEELIAATRSLIDQCCQEPAESDHNSLYTDEEIDDYHFDDSPSENCNDETWARHWHYRYAD